MAEISDLLHTLPFQGIGILDAVDMVAGHVSNSVFYHPSKDSCCLLAKDQRSSNGSCHEPTLALFFVSPVFGFRPKRVNLV